MRDVRLLRGGVMFLKFLVRIGKRIFLKEKILYWVPVDVMKNLNNFAANDKHHSGIMLTILFMALNTLL